MKMKTFDWVVYALLVIGGLNWGLIGFFDFNLVTALFGSGIVTTIVYDLVGLSAVWSIIQMVRK